jgi:hypothetical protein
MEIFELTPVTHNKRQWKRGGYGVCGIDAVGNTYFNPAAIGPLAILIALSSGRACQIHEIDGVERMLVTVAWAKTAFPSLAADLDILDSRIRRLAAGQPLEQCN